jgi:predicted  nucleic acid-binding Zn-ribbon protein
MRPTQKGLDTLRATLVLAEGELEEAKKQVLDGTQPTVDALAEAEAQGSRLAADMVSRERELEFLSREVDEAERVLAALCLRREKALVERMVMGQRQRECGIKVSQLTRRLVQERAVAAPLLKARQSKVDRLSNRIRMREAHREARLSGLFPGDGSVRV